MSFWEQTSVFSLKACGPVLSSRSLSVSHQMKENSDGDGGLHLPPTLPPCSR